MVALGLGMTMRRILLAVGGPDGSQRADAGVTEICGVRRASHLRHAGPGYTLGGAGTAILFHETAPQ